MKKTVLFLGVILITFLSIDNVNALQQIQTIIEDTCDIKACPDATTRCCTLKNGLSYYNNA